MGVSSKVAKYISKSLSKQKEKAKDARGSKKEVETRIEKANREDRELGDPEWYQPRHPDETPRSIYYGIRPDDKEFVNLTKKEQNEIKKFYKEIEDRNPGVFKGAKKQPPTKMFTGGMPKKAPAKKPMPAKKPVAKRPAPKKK